MMQMHMKMQAMNLLKISNINPLAAAVKETE
jgi:hypothetical protein